MQIKLENCPICKENKWHDLDYLRDHKYWYDRDYIYDEPIGFKVCKECGFVTYEYTDDAELKRRYEDLRKVVDANSIITGNRKIEYHKKFLKDEKIIIGNPLISSCVVDYGCGIGYILSWLKFIWGSNDSIKYYGIELNDVQKNYAMNEYGLDIIDDMPECPVDLIICYHVFEHLQHPDKILKKFWDALTENGTLYLSVPNVIKDDILDEASGGLTASFEELYHLNHVNQFSKTSLKNILETNGFKITKEDDKTYGYTVICKKIKPVKDIEKQNYLEIEKLIKKQKDSIDLYNQGKYEEARIFHTGYIDAWCMNSVKNFKDLPQQEKVLLEAMEATDGHYKIKRQLAHLYFHWDENKAGESKLTNHIKRSKELLEELIIDKPGMEDYYYYLALIENNYYKNHDRARELFQKMIEINPSKWAEVQNLIGFIWKDKYN